MCYVKILQQFRLCKKIFIDFCYIKNQRVFFKYIEPNLIFSGENSFRTFAICFFCMAPNFLNNFFWVKAQKHELNFLQTWKAKKNLKAKKTWIYFLQAWKSSRNMGSIFCKLHKLKKHEISIFCELDKIDLNFL